MKRQSTIVPPRRALGDRCPTCHYWLALSDRECHRCMLQNHAPFRLETLPARLTVPLPSVLDVAAQLVLWALTATLYVGIIWVVANTLAGQ